MTLIQLIKAGSLWASLANILMVLGNYMTGDLRRHERRLDDGGTFDAVHAVTSGCEEVTWFWHILASRVGHHGAAVGGSPRNDGAHVAKAPPQQDAGDDQKQEAAGQPHTHSKLPARPVMALAVLALSTEHLALVPHRIGRLTCHAQKVGGLGEEVGQVRAGLTDRDALLMVEAFPSEAHEQTIPVGVIHDTVKRVQAGGRWRPAHPGWGGRDVVDRYAHYKKLTVRMKHFLRFFSCLPQVWTQTVKE